MDFWDVVETQLKELRSAASSADVLRILATEHNPYGDPGITHAPSFFAGGGGDDSVLGALESAGWHVTWSQADYYYVMQAPNGDKTTYIEGDVFDGATHRTGSSL